MPKESKRKISKCHNIKKKCMKSNFFIGRRSRPIHASVNYWKASHDPHERRVRLGYWTLHGQAPQSSFTQGPTNPSHAPSNAPLSWYPERTFFHGCPSRCIRYHFRSRFKPAPSGRNFGWTRPSFTTRSSKIQYWYFGTQHPFSTLCVSCPFFPPSVTNYVISFGAQRNW